jgi:hypothetical protein
VPEIPSPKHQEIQEFGQNQFWNNVTKNTDNMLVEQGCASIKQTFLKFIAKMW